MPYYYVVLKEDASSIKLIEMKTDAWPASLPTSHMLYLEPKPECPQIVIWVQSPNICTGSTITIYSYILNTTGAAYQWYVNGNPVSAPEGQESKLEYYPDDKDQVLCKLTGDTCGEATSNTIEITVTQKRTPTVEIEWYNYSRPEDSQYVCSGDTVLYKATGVTYGGTYPYPTFQWYTNRTGSWIAIPGQTREVMLYRPISGETICVYMGSNEWCISPTGATDCVTMDVNTKLLVNAEITPTGYTCSGTQVTYMVTGITNGGSAPTFQWYVNSTTQVGQTSSAFTYTPINFDVISVKVTSSLKCVYGPATITHNAVVAPNVSVSITIRSTPEADNGVVTIYTGGSVVFYVKSSTECPDQRDNTYEWFLNDVAVPYSDDRTYTLNSPTDGDEVYCEITADCACRTGNPAKSNTITVNIISNPKYVYIKEEDSTICTGTSVCFSAYTYNFDPSPTPTYQWKVNGNNVGTNSSTYCSNTLADGDVVSCVVTQNESYTSLNPVTMDVTNYTNSTVDIKIYPPGLYYCEGCLLEFVVCGATNFGTNPSFQWQHWDGNSWNNVGSNQPFIFKSDMSDKDKMRVIMDPDEECVYSSTSNEIEVNLIGEPSVSVAADADCITLDEEITYTATPTNGGPSPTYNWYIVPNSTPETEHSNIFTYTFTTPGAKTVMCEMISSAVCIIPPNIVPQVAYAAVYLEECGCQCYTGFQPTPDGTMCYKTETTSTLGTQITQIAVAKTYEEYSWYGTIFFDDGYNTGGTTSAGYTIFNSGIWTSNWVATEGPMNRSGLWATNHGPNQTIHFSYCFTLTEGKTYYVGIGCDNYATIRMDGNLIVQQDRPALTQQFGAGELVTFKYWFVYPINLTAGFHVIELLGHNVESIAALGAEIYDATLEEMINATNVTTFYNDHVLFSTKDKRGTNIQIISGGGLHCSGGWSLVLCDGDPYCTKTTYIECGATP